MKLLAEYFVTADVDPYRLKSKRLDLGLSLQEVAHRSELSITLLKALEEGRLSDVGSPALVRIHLLAYARALDADQFPATGEKECQAALTHPNPSNPPPARKPFSADGRGLVKLAAFLGIGVLLVAMGYHLGQSARKAADHATSRWSEPANAAGPAAVLEPPARLATLPDANATSEERPNPAAAPDPVGEAKTDPLAAAAPAPELATAGRAEATASDDRDALRPMRSPHRFEIEAFQSSWVEVRGDGRRAEGVLLHPGDKRSWSVEAEVQIVVGNAGGVQMKWDDVPIDPGCRPGQVLRFRLPQAVITGKYR